jgi:hypothetical protein
MKPQKKSRVRKHKTPSRRAQKPVSPPITPVWNDRIGSLSLTGQELIDLHRKAISERFLLNAFANANWAGEIPNPFPSAAKRAREKQINDIVGNLNRHLKGKPLHFHTSDKGQLVYWQIRLST